jgi:uncharacterized protein YfkK (UPF0435 family)
LEAGRVVEVRRVNASQEGCLADVFDFGMGKESIVAEQKKDQDLTEIYKSVKKESRSLLGKMWLHGQKKQKYSGGSGHG